MKASRFGTNRNLRRRVLVAAVLTAALAVAASCANDSTQEDSAATSTSVAVTIVDDDDAAEADGVTHEFVVPAGTTERVRMGEKVDVIPRQIDISVGDRIRVRNEDSETAMLGLFDVRPDETVTMNFNEVNVLTGTIFGDEPAGCGTPPPKSKQFIINVRP